MFVYRLLVITTSECIIMCADQILFRPERVRQEQEQEQEKKEPTIFNQVNIKSTCIRK